MGGSDDPDDPDDPDASECSECPTAPNFAIAFSPFIQLLRRACARACGYPSALPRGSRAPPSPRVRRQ
jgi:hypothetical protein